MNRQADWLVSITLALTLLGVTLTGLVIRQAWLFSAIAWLMLFIYVIYALLTRNSLAFRLLLFALLADLPQLAVDWYHVRIVKTLVYDYAFFRILETPDYILAGWGFAFFQLGYLLLRLAPRFGWRRLGLAVTLGGTLIHSWYEEMAYQAGAWRYIHAALLAHVSIWVIFSFLFIIATICYLLFRLKDRTDWQSWAAAGLLNGVGIFIYSALAVQFLR
ncbi:MAG: DUF6989 domain-containing protein [Anaerolineales bacterium]